jgi:GNAT superfamily N-acetyltransferase
VAERRAKAPRAASRKPARATPAAAPARAPRVRWTVLPATRERWADVAALFGVKGACAGCWCMWPRVTAAESRALGAEGRKKRFRGLIARDAVPGLIAYDGETPAGWIAIAPRPEYRRLEGSRVLAPVDDQEVWSVPCFFVGREHRGKGLTVALLKAACRWAASQGARVVEGYPNDPTHSKSPRMPAAFAWMGIASSYTAAGFKEVARRSPLRPIMRKRVRAARG